MVHLALEIQILRLDQLPALAARVVAGGGRLALGSARMVARLDRSHVAMAALINELVGSGRQDI